MLSMFDHVFNNRALISVSDKTGIAEFARELLRHDIELISTGNTAKHLKSQGIEVIEVSEYTEFPEIMQGRVKTLHPKIHGGILGRRTEDKLIMEELKIPPIDLIIVNLYPFESNPSIENIDIGGSTLLRAGAKNHAWVTVVVDPNDYAMILKSLDAGISFQSRQNLALKAFQHSAAYETAIANYFNENIQTFCFPVSKDVHENTEATTELPEHLFIHGQKNKTLDLRYGENPHQKAGYYNLEENTPSFSLLQGKALSYNNLVDCDTAFRCVCEFDKPACVIVKHANPCGVAQDTSLDAAYEKAYQCDPNSAFGGIIAFNGILDAKLSEKIINQQFVEVIIAKEITEDAQEILKTKPAIRIIQCPQLLHTPWEIKPAFNGILVQEWDLKTITEHDFETVTQTEPTLAEVRDLMFAWRVAKFVKSNAIVYAKNNMTLGIGAGQMSRVLSSEIGILRAERESLALKGAVMASDAFFPFRDSIDLAAKAGITAIIQPGGSKRDAEIIQAANEYGISMAFTHIRHFKH